MGVGILVVVATASLLGAQAGTEPGVASVSDRPSDDTLQREDEVIVENASDPLAADLRLIVHRVDALAGDDDTFSRIILRVGEVDRTDGERTPVSRRFPTTSEPALRAVGFPNLDGVPAGTPAAVVSNDPRTPNVTVLLPAPQWVRTTPRFSYEFLLGHELGGRTATLHDRVDSVGAGGGRLYTDTLLARLAVNEGVASYVGAQYVERYGGAFDPAAVLEPEPDSHWANRVESAAYASGYRYAAANDLREPSAARVNTTASVLHPTANRSLGSLPERTVAVSTDALGEPTETDRLGELLVRELLVAVGHSQSDASETAAGWRNGRIDRYDTPNGTVTVWTTVWANETAAATFARVYETNVSTTRVGSFDRGQCGSTERLLLVDGRRVTVVRCS